MRLDFPEKRWLTFEEMDQWFAAYDAAEVEQGRVDLGGIEWDLCFTSDMVRAVRTAELIYDGKTVRTELLRELERPAFRTRLKLPFLMWAVLVRIRWKVESSWRRQIRQRVSAILAEIMACGDANVLIVGHGGIMIYLADELRQRGFQGPRIQRPENGKLYVFEERR